MAKLTLSTGSNVGDRQFYLAEARSLLGQRLGEILFASEVRETEAWGYTDQSPFLNQLLILESPVAVSGEAIRHDLHRVLDVTQQIEHELGRTRDLSWGPRTLDIDLIFVDDLRYEDERISLPHPWWRRRPFVRELLPRFPAPELGLFSEY
ncbi:2-amino-4-hydroxy-6-hydroxymethyldihydropteridine diphosphokinase [Lewinella aquimaris]|uniref:2-amino-4-hydroxy-6-hydroxymethyldihydropteridine pyrophosphokinase n=1 Tax=Neolewinella aquimaris TaxID=1835722 RepID=A0A840E3E2_9BACT|nr:2-amino-4-hydroxy-6-hydroxymethyldihydropteridine diphosphokinase [Neolewinella aquimaris]MBB4078185.1 2-amino-4-hydroxy-6-hydroxymethyldihydropteridine diphosphokinase [Neolewinella aquimaris]